jgi:hypothetical protein
MRKPFSEIDFAPESIMLIVALIVVLALTAFVLVGCGESEPSTGQLELGEDPDAEAVVIHGNIFQEADEVTFHDSDVVFPEIKTIVEQRTKPIEFGEDGVAWTQNMSFLSGPIEEVFDEELGGIVRTVPQGWTIGIREDGVVVWKLTEDDAWEGITKEPHHIGIITDETNLIEEEP